MTDRKPPPGGPPRFENYRPANERAEPPRNAPRYDERMPPERDPRTAGRPPYEARAPRPPQGGPGGYPPQQMDPRDRVRTYPPPGGVPAPPAGGMPRPRRFEDNDERSWSLPRIALMVVGFGVVVAGLGAFGLSMMSADFVRDRIVAAVKERTGRDLVVAGSASFNIFPSVGVSLEKVSLSAAPGMTGAPPLVSMGALDVNVSLLPLLQRELRIKRLVLREPQFNLAIDANGRKSWQFAAASGPDTSEPVRFAQAAGTASDAPGGLASDAPASGQNKSAPLRLSQLKLDDVRVDNGTIRYSDARSGSQHEIKSLNVSMALPAITEPLTAKGDMVWNGKPATFDAALTSVSSVLDDRPAKLKVNLASDALTTSFEGSASFRDTIEAEGILSAQSPSVRGLARWMGVALPPSKGFGALTAKGLLRTSGKTTTFASAEISLDGSIARGQISVENGGARPRVNANLKLTELDLNTYKHDGSISEPPPERPAAKEAESSPADGASSINDLLARDPAEPGPRVKGYTHREGWSDEPYDLDLLGLVDADAKLSVARLFVRDIKVGQSELTVALKNRVMKTTIDDMRLYDGRGRGTVTLDGSQQASANIGANITLENISGQPLLKDAADIDKLAGKGRLAFALAGQGQNERQLVETLNGKIEASFADGAIIGINIPQMIRGIGQGRFSAGTAPTDKTDFSEMTSTWSVTNGVAQNQDLKLVSPLMRLTGSGSVMLPQRELDYMLKPRIVADLQGQGGQQNTGGIEIPVRVTGPWERPKFAPDLKGVLKDPKTTETIKEIGKQLKGKSAGEIANELLGSGNSADGQTQKSKAKDLLKQFLGPQ
jgi:AsmA protein